MNNEKLMDITFYFLLVILIVLVYFAVIIQNYTLEMQNYGETIAKERGCEYIGFTESLPQIQVLDCDGEIVHIRVPDSYYTR